MVISDLFQAIGLTSRFMTKSFEVFVQERNWHREKYYLFHFH